MQIELVVNPLSGFVVGLFRVRTVNEERGWILYQSMGSIIEATCHRNHLEISRHIVRLECSMSTMV